MAPSCRVETVRLRSRPCLMISCAFSLAIATETTRYSGDPLRSVVRWVWVCGPGDNPASWVYPLGSSSGQRSGRRACKRLSPAGGAGLSLALHLPSRQLRLPRVWGTWRQLAESDIVAHTPTLSHTQTSQLCCLSLPTTPMCTDGRSILVVTNAPTVWMVARRSKVV
jgi:hypothetical protein